MTSDKTLVPIEQKQVVFYDDELTAVLVEADGRQEVYVPIRPICQFLGVAWDPQRRRINRDPVLSAEAKGVTVTVTPGGRQAMICLPLDYISGFLFGINASRVKEEVRERLIKYQRECYKVLAEAFQEGRLTDDPVFDELLQQVDTEAVQAYQIAQAVMKIARNQIMMEARLTGRMDVYEQRLESIEATLGDPGRAVTESQAMQISQAVKAVAMQLSKQSRRNEYGGVYGELYRRYEMNSYKLLPVAKFDEAMQWLNAWLQDLTGDVPF